MNNLTDVLAFVIGVILLVLAIAWSMFLPSVGLLWLMGVV